MELPASLTGDEVKEILHKRGATRIDRHSCSMCGFMCHYVIDGDNVFYNSGCNCIRGGDLIEPRIFDDIANSYNIQDNDKARASILDLITGETKG